jgi:SsrA-binding protein
VAKKPAEEATGKKIMVVNRKARFDYHIVEVFEAGLVLTGQEIKSIRAGGASLAESYIRPKHSELFLVGCHIQLYSHSGLREYDPVRDRKLLMHRSEIDKLRGKVESKGFTLVPLSLYLKDGYAKLEVALAKGKAAPDKRDATKEREAQRDMARAIKGGR